MSNLLARRKVPANTKTCEVLETSQVSRPHYPQAGDLSLFDLPALICRCIDTLRARGIGRVTLKCLLIVDGRLQLHIHYFRALDALCAERIAVGDDGTGHYEVYELAMADIAIVWTKAWRGL